MTERYRSYNAVLKNEFPERIQKISIHAGFTCPNRDGSKGTGGCTYCNNQSFSPGYAQPTKSVYEQLTEGIDFFRQKYPNQRYLAYFQSYTNTYDKTENLIRIYEEALAHPQVAGMVIGTRPDCITGELLDYFAQRSKTRYVMIEYGVESTDDETLRQINRGHTFAEAEEAVILTANKGLRTAIHLILGLPGESRETILSHAEKVSKLPITALKLHQLQLIRGTKMARQYAENPAHFQLMSAEEYTDLAVDFLERLHPAIAVERFVSQSPYALLIAPHWGLKNFEFVAKIEKRLEERQTWQGRLLAKR